MVRNWKTISRFPVIRGELIMSWDVIDSWQEELESMNGRKEGKSFVYPESTVKKLEIKALLYICLQVFDEQ